MSEAIAIIIRAAKAGMRMRGGRHMFPHQTWKCRTQEWEDLAKKENDVSRLKEQEEDEALNWVSKGSVGKGIRWRKNSSWWANLDLHGLWDCWNVCVEPSGEWVKIQVRISRHRAAQRDSGVINKEVISNSPPYRNCTDVLLLNRIYRKF